LHGVIQTSTEVERFTFCNITRWFDYLQHYEGIYNVVQLPIIKIKKDINPSLLENSQSQAKSQKSANKQSEAPIIQQEKVTEGEKKQEKEPIKQKRTPTEAKEEKIDVCRLDIRIGKIISVKAHEEADTLYVEQIDLGESKSRTVVSGLRKYVSLEEMQNRLVVVLCNLKPSKLKGVLSEAMVLAASNHDHTQVELLIPPEGSIPGERVSFEGFSGEPDEQLNPKKKVWETIQPELSTDESCIALYKNTPFKTSSGVIKVKSITKGSIK